MYSLVCVSIEKIYQTLDTVFHRLSKHLEFRQKYSVARRVFDSLLDRCLDISMKHYLSCLIYYLKLSAGVWVKVCVTGVRDGCVVARQSHALPNATKKCSNHANLTITSLSSLPV